MLKVAWFGVVELNNGVSMIEVGTSLVVVVLEYSVGTVLSVVSVVVVLSKTREGSTILTTSEDTGTMEDTGTIEEVYASVVAMEE